MRIGKTFLPFAFGALALSVAGCNTVDITGNITIEADLPAVDSGKINAEIKIVPRPKSPSINREKQVRSVIDGKTLELSRSDIELIARVVDTEVIKFKNASVMRQQVNAVVDTILNRIVSSQFPNSVVGVLDEHRQFSKITGPKRLKPYGSVLRTPNASNRVLAMVDDHIRARVGGAASTVGGDLNYLNPLYSDRVNLLSWGNDVVRQAKSKGQVFGAGRGRHYHGTARGYAPVAPYTLRLTK